MAVMVTCGLLMVCWLPAAEPDTVTLAVTFDPARFAVNVLLLVAPRATFAINKYLLAPVNPVCPDTVKLILADQPIPVPEILVSVASLTPLLLAS